MILMINSGHGVVYVQYQLRSSRRQSPRSSREIVRELAGHSVRYGSTRRKGNAWYVKPPALSSLLLSRTLLSYRYVVRESRGWLPLTVVLTPNRNTQRSWSSLLPYPAQSPTRSQDHQES
jgi:hypothetical protein